MAFGLGYDYGYMNARIRGMKSRLLGRKALDDLVMKPDVASLISELESTPYKEDIEASSAKYTGIYCIEYALRLNFSRTFYKILEFVDDKDAQKYIKIFVRHWDVQNIKAILRGKSIHASSEEIYECLMPMGDLDEVALAEMIKQPDVKAVIDLMATWKIGYVTPLMRHFKEYLQDHDLIVLESALDNYYYESAMSAIKKNDYDGRLIRDLLATDIDVINLKTAMRMIRDKIDPKDAEKFFLLGGRRLRKEFLVSLLNTKSIDGAIKLLEPTPYYFLSQAPEEYVKKEMISGIEKQLDKFMILEGTRVYRGDPLSIAIAIGYFWMKFNEITNIRIISRCKTTDMSDERIKEELIYV